MTTLNFPAPGDSNPGDKVQTGDIEWIYSAKGFWYSEVTGGVAAGGASVSIGQTPPTNPTPEAGDLWWNSSEDSGRMFIYTGSEWTESSPQGAGGEGGGIEEAPNDGQQYARQNQDWSVITGGGGSGDTTINYSGAAAWGEVKLDGTKSGAGLNFTSTRTADPGVYQITFTNAMPSTDYSVQVTALNTLDVTTVAGGKTTTSFLVRTFRDGTGLTNSGFTFAVHATNALPPRGGTGADAWSTVQGSGSDVLITASFNIAGVTNDNPGEYLYTFTTPMPSTQYAVTATIANTTGDRAIACSARTTTGFTINTRDATGDLASVSHSVVVHATNAQLPDTISQEELDSILDLVENPPSGYGGASAWGITSSDATILNSLNISGVEKLGTGVYEYTFTNAMPSANYSAVASPKTQNAGTVTVSAVDATKFRVRLFDGAGAAKDLDHSFVVHASNATPPRGGTGADAWCSTAVDGIVPASFNIASVTRAGTGLYDYVFSTPMPNIAYTVVVSPAGGAAIARTCAVSNKVETGFRIEVKNLEGNYANESHYVVVHATNAQLPDTITQEELDTILDLAENPPSGYGGASAWGLCDPSNNNNVIGGLNVKDAVQISTGYYEITFTTPMPNANYSVSLTPNTITGPNERIGRVSERNADKFRVAFVDKAGSSAPTAFSFAVHATNAQPPRGGTGADAWARTNSTGDIQSSYNLNCVKSSNGVYNYTFNTAMPNPQYAVVCNASSPARTAGISSLTTTGFTLTTVTDDGTESDGAHHVVVHATNAQLPDTITQEELDAALNSPGVSAWGFTTAGGGLLNGLNVRLTDNSTEGRYEYTFDTPMPNDQYAIVATSIRTDSSERTINWREPTANGFVLEACTSDGTLTNGAHSFTIHATNAQPPRGGTGADAWARTNSTGDIHSSYNLTCVKSGAGVYNYTFNVEMPNAFYAVVGNTSATARTIGVSNNTTTGFTLTTSNQSGTASDSGHHLAVFATNATLPSPLSQDDLLFTDGRNASEAMQEFKDGISVTGGRVLADGSDGQLIRAEQTGAKDSHTGFWASAASGSSTTGTTRGYFASATLAVNSDGADTIRGFESNIAIRPGQENNYNFYASGDAPSYFGGILRTGNVTTPNAGQNPDQNWLWTTGNATSNAVRIRNSVVSVSTYTSGTATSASFAANRLGDNNGRFHAFYRGGTEVGFIRLNGSGANPTGSIFNAGTTSTTSAAYTVNSDYRLKSNIVDAPAASDLIKQIQPRQYSIEEQDNVIGFVAHELQGVIPAAVVGEKDAVDGEGNPVLQSVDRSVLVPYLVKALQEALTRIEELESNTLQPLYATEADLPSASEHHGKTAHVHATGSLYFAHAGSWVKLQNA